MPNANAEQVKMNKPGDGVGLGGELAEEQQLRCTKCHQRDKM